MLFTEDLVHGERLLRRTGITDGSLVQGVRSRLTGNHESIVMHARSGTIRVIHGEHRAIKLKQIYGEEE